MKWKKVKEEKREGKKDKGSGEERWRGKGGAGVDNDSLCVRPRNCWSRDCRLKCTMSLTTGQAGSVPALSKAL